MAYFETAKLCRMTNKIEHVAKLGRAKYLSVFPNDMFTSHSNLFIFVSVTDYVFSQELDPLSTLSDPLGDC